MKFKYAFRGISRNIIFSILIILQLVFALIVIYENLDLYEKVSYESKTINNFFANKKLYELEEVSFTNDTNNIKSFKLSAIEDYLNLSHDFQFIELGNTTFPLQKFSGYQQFRANNYEFKEQNIDFFTANNIVVNQKLFSKVNIQLNEGRIFNKYEFDRSYGDNNIIPVLVGYNYNKYFKVNDIITYVRGEAGVRKAKIVGIIKKDQYIPGDLLSVDKKYINLNDYILTTNSFEDKDISAVESILTMNYLVFDKSVSDDKINNTANNIKKMFQENLNKKVGLRNLNQYVQAETEIFTNQSKLVFVVSLIIIVFVCISLITTLLDIIIRRKDEFSIHLLSGGSLRDICVINYLHVLFILLFSYLISLMFVYILFKVLNIKIIMIMFIGLLIFSALISFIPIRKILSLNISDLVKGVE